jgi:large subunit ribosomal protein L30
MAKLRVTLVKSPIGHKPNQILTIKALGLTTRISSTVVVSDENEAILGMIKTIAHLVKVEAVK